MRRIGWVLFAVTCLMFVLQALFLSASTQPLLSPEVLVDQVFPLLGLGAVIGAGVGALIVSRYPHNTIGWLLLIGQLGSAISIAADAFGRLVVQGVIDAPTAGTVAAYLNRLFDATFTIAILAIIFMLAPDGRALSRRWRPAIAVPITSLVLHVATMLAQPVSDFVPGAVVGFEPVSVWFLLGSFCTLLLSIALGAAALLLRLRRSTGQQRLQLRWIATSAAILAAAFLAYAIAQLLNLAGWILPEVTLLAYIFFSVSVGVAILKYRLYDIDVILSRAIALGVLAVFVTVGYIGVVVAIAAVLAAIGEPGSSLYWPSLVATALVAVAFQPVRRHVLRLADQLVYGSRAAPYEALAGLSRRLADSPSPDELPLRVAQASGRAVGAIGTTVTITEPASGTVLRSAAWSGEATGFGATVSTTMVSPSPVSTTMVSPSPVSTSPVSTSPVSTAQNLRLPVRDMAEQVGSIEVTMPPGRTLREFERNLLQDVAAQAGVAFRNVLLEAELAARVAQGEATSAALAASRRRLVGVEDEARERLSAAIGRRVVPHLTAVAAELDGPSGFPDQKQLGGALEGLIGEVERALEELRLVCRGVFPALLERRGLVPALVAHVDSGHPGARLDVDEAAERRLDRAVEAAGYVFCTEVTPPDRPCVIGLRIDQGALIASVTASSWAGEAFDPTVDPSVQSAWQHARDRVAAADGEIVLRRDGGQLTVSAVIPLDDQAGRGPAIPAQTSSSRSGPKADFGT